MSIQKIVLGGGCFWCLESVFQGIVGVQSVVSGYAGGQDENPSYENVCSGITGHAEVVEVTFDSLIINLADLLKIFFTIHDPTTLNRQGNDVGTQYRSVIFYADPEEKSVAESVIADLKKRAVFHDEIVTTLEPLTTFHVAEDYHQNYFEKNPGNPYCRFSIPPKRAKVLKNFSSFIK
ncbi:peptide-methionine (S)-S-oxide reductase MsrA [Porticoccus sp.]